MCGMPLTFACAAAGGRGWSGEEVVKGVLYGLINVIMLVPVTASFATIIFRHEAYAPYLPGTRHAGSHGWV